MNIDDLQYTYEPGAAGQVVTPGGAKNALISVHERVGEEAECATIIVASASMELSTAIRDRIGALLAGAEGAELELEAVEEGTCIACGCSTFDACVGIPGTGTCAWAIPPNADGEGLCTNPECNTPANRRKLHDEESE